jgi:2-polyprenyl-3-methyl-5-hydroxy-6-metoxy-1,4-benzoquinol methylase
MSKKRQATERLSLQKVLEKLPSTRHYARTILGRLSRIHPIYPNAVIVDIGAAQGRFLIACSELGFQAIGIEPWYGAREIATCLAEHEGVRITILAGVAEELPLKDESCHIVHASSVVEHVSSAQAVFNEAWRVLKPNGIFWFSTASSMCPRQCEISGFPLFGWYPDRLKQHIMEYAKMYKPHLIGYTETPAIHWFTPWKARRMLRQAGFSQVYDRWDLRLPSEGGWIYRKALNVVKSSGITKFIANVLVPACSYAALKPLMGTSNEHRKC